MKSILVVEDELSIRSFVCLNLKKKDYNIYEAETGNEALSIFQSNQIDIVLLDLMLPDMDGFRVCEEIRSISGTVGIIILSARTQDEDKVKGLIQGADDYLTKPFSMTELDARILSLFRRMECIEEKVDNSMIKVGSYQLDLINKKVVFNGNEIKLTPTEYSLLHFLLTHRNQVFTRDDLLDGVWGINYVGDIKVVDVNMRRIRTKIELDPSNPEHLITVWGYGYQWKD